MKVCEVLSVRASETLRKHLNVHLGDNSFFENGLARLLTTSRWIPNTPVCFIMSWSTAALSHSLYLPRHPLTAPTLKETIKEAPVF
jgi:hypothetical protein